MKTDGQYNEDKVCYCTDCLSLRVICMEDEDECYCDKCGSTDIDETSIQEWQELYKKRYNVEYLNSNKNGREQNTVKCGRGHRI
jgi:hypothetical protein